MIKSSAERYMRRCFELASKGLGRTGTNPIVGAVLVYNDEIIGEGYHQMQGGPHAEVNAVESVTATNKKFISASHLYVSLEPCNHFGRTGPCTHLILQQKIKKVFISAIDPNHQVQGNGIQFLADNGVEVQAGLLEREGQELIRPFKISSYYKRPFVILKSAISADGFIGKEGQKIELSGPETKNMVHLWRTQISGIAVGTKTAIIDNPLLTARAANGPNPLRVIFDWDEKIPKSHHVLSDNEKSLIFTDIAKYNGFKEIKKQLIRLDAKDQNLQKILEIVYENGIGILMVEGGAKLIQSFIRNDLWDEARLIKTTKLLHSGIKFPEIEGSKEKIIPAGDDLIEYILNPRDIK